MAKLPVVLDASALLAVMQAETGYENVALHLPGAIISTVNVSEVLVKLVDRGVDLNDAVTSVRAFELDIRAFDEDQALAAAALRRQSRRHGHSFGDRACVALARSIGGAALTADRAWAGLEGVELIR